MDLADGEMVIFGVSSCIINENFFVAFFGVCGCWDLELMSARIAVLEVTLAIVLSNKSFIFR